jgi:copper oxidase (laccase) domain-containing protein
MSIDQTLPLLLPNWPGLPAGIGAICTLRAGGMSGVPFDDGMGNGGLNLGSHVGDDPVAVAQNRARLQRVLPAEPFWLQQVHGSKVINLDHALGEPQADASFTTRPGVVCAIQTADCLPVLLWGVSGSVRSPGPASVPEDPVQGGAHGAGTKIDGRGAQGTGCGWGDLPGQEGMASSPCTQSTGGHRYVVGAAHAGWRGLAGGVLQNTVQAMRAAGAEQVSAWLGPAIGPQQFEVGPDVVAAFANLPHDQAGRNPAFVPHPQHHGKYLANLYQLARVALARVGVQQVSGGEYCTVSMPLSFFSYRRDGSTGRMVSCIWLK